jgi:hyperosmotically inducible protein
MGAVLIAFLSGAAYGAENGGSERLPKEAPAPPESKPAPKPEPKKKGDEEPKQADPPKLRAEPPKAEDKPGKAEEKPPKADDKPAKVEEKASKSEEPAPKSEPKPDEAGKKVVTSMPITIKLALMQDPLLFPFEIEVEMDGRKAVLSGTVSSEEEKAKATELARKIEGVEAVVNKLSVSGAVRASWDKRRDELIEHLVKERLNKSETLKAVGFETKVENGVVTLSGKTRFQVIALEAAEAARQVPGVRAVNAAPVQITAKD